MSGEVRRRKSASALLVEDVGHVGARQLVEVASEQAGHVVVGPERHGRVVEEPQPVGVGLEETPDERGIRSRALRRARGHVIDHASPDRSDGMMGSWTYEMLGTPAGADRSDSTPSVTSSGARTVSWSSQAEAIRQVVAEAVLADEVGVDFFGIGEHHRPDFAISAPDVVLAAIAGQTDRIRLGTSVTVLSSDDPIRVYQRFATLDAVSAGRAEVTLGRGSFTESFPLFGLSPRRLRGALLREARPLRAAARGGPVTWEGTIRPPLEASAGLPAHRAAGCPPGSASAAPPSRWSAPRRTACPSCSPSSAARPRSSSRSSTSTTARSRTTATAPCPISMHSPGHIAATDELAREQMYPHQAAAFTKIGRERGWGPYTPEQFEASAGPEGALFVGSPETVAQKIAWAMRTLGLSRFQLKYAVGTLPHAQRLESIRLYGTEVVPRVRELLS